MTRAQFKARLRALTLTTVEFAQWTGVHQSTVRAWGTRRGGRRDPLPYPLWVDELIGAWEDLAAWESAYPDDADSGGY